MQLPINPTALPQRGACVCKADWKVNDCESDIWQAVVRFVNCAYEKGNFEEVSAMSAVDYLFSVRNVAIYWDFENLHAALFDEKNGAGVYAGGDLRFRPQDALIDVRAILKFAASFGPLVVNRAYCNWQFYGRYRYDLLDGAVELIQLFPPGFGTKNGADIKLCLDAYEDVLRLGHINTVVIVGGDSDFMPLSQKIKATGRTVVGIGTRKSTNRHWVQSCHEFRFYEDLAAEAEKEQPSGPRAVAAVATEQKHPAFGVLKRVVGG
ncbi:NYN domain-containing protein [Tahibacter aquaticus]|uniref:NYN domain-containing protein n=1 Tax=Tahibacter aquaticus TaxID=520092 RepID=UPI001AACAD8A|nr:NYN domain-containing protein [Tahibacter aquaticus]